MEMCGPVTQLHGADTLRKADRHRLGDRPANEEIGTVAPEMLKGRKPEEDNSRGLLLLESTPNLILVHGYCDSNRFPTSDFSNAIDFTDADSGSNN